MYACQSLRIGHHSNARRRLASQTDSNPNFSEPKTACILAKGGRNNVYIRGQEPGNKLA